MTSWRKACALVLVVSGTIWVTSLNNPSAPSFAQGCPTDRQEFVRTVLPSLVDFSLIPGSQITSDQAGGPFANAPEDELALFLPIPSSSESGAATLAQLTLTSNGLDVEGTVGKAYTGRVTPLLSSLPDSRVQLFVRPDNGQRPGYIAGFLILDLKAEEDPTVFARDNWYFIEPLRPLLKNGVGPGFACSEADLERAFPAADELAEHNHILYEVRDTDFLIDLDPYGVDLQTEGGGEGESVHPPALTHSLNLIKQAGQGGTSVVDLVVIADPSYVALKGDVQNAKDDILALMNVMFHNLGSPGSFYTDFGVNVDLRFLGDRLELWESDSARADGVAGQAPGANFDALPNAFQLLCDLVQNVPHATRPNDRPTIVHLLTGIDLAAFPPAEVGLSDAADGFCGAAGCGGTGFAVVGLSEGIGGYAQASNNGYCGAFPYSHLDLPSPAQHSLSQHRAKADKSGSNKNFEATLFQRWVLLAHEIGHNLGAYHSSSDRLRIVKSVMNAQIDDSLNYYLASENQSELQDCLTPGKLNPC